LHLGSASNIITGTKWFINQEVIVTNTRELKNYFFVSKVIPMRSPFFVVYPSKYNAVTSLMKNKLYQKQAFLADGN